MEPYLYLILFISFTALLASINSNKEKKRLLISMFGFSGIIIFQSLRKWTVGIDVGTYLQFFEFLSGDESVSSFIEGFYAIEIGYLYFNKAISLLTTDNQIFLSIVSASIFIPIGYVIYKNSKNVFLSIISLIGLGIFNFTFSGIRQSIAIGITFLSFVFIKKKKWIWFSLLVLAASTFHKSALVFLFAYPLYYLKIDKKHFLLVIMSILLIFLFKSFLLKFLVSSVFEKYDNSELFVSTGAYSMFIIMLFLYCVSVFVPHKQGETENLNAYRNYLLAATIIQIAASESQVAMRAGYYYFIFVVLLLPLIIRSFPDEKYWPSLTFIATTICLVFYFLTTVNSSLDPYLLFWE